MGYYWGYDRVGLGFASSLFMIIFWVLVVALVIVLVRRMSGHEHANHGWNHPSSPSALDILNERYAKGEIDKKEYEEKKKDILGS